MGQGNDQSRDQRPHGVITKPVDNTKNIVYNNNILNHVGESR